jgi:3-hydroxy-9,10-secoandrosta-1,3,5(10)-triene-9,17-dione monooxygenase
VPVTATHAAGPPAFVDAEGAERLARNLAPLVSEHSAAAEANRVVSPEVVDALRASGLFSVVGAKSFGGAEAGIEALVRATIEVASACGSAGWVYGVLAGHSWMLNLFPPEAQGEVASDPGALTATVFRLGGTAKKVAGGYRIEGGFGRFCSGVDHAAWVLVGMTVAGEAEEKPEQRFLLVPRSDITIIDDWETLGMRGTGSRSIEIAEAFVPEYRSVALIDMIKGTTPGADYHGASFYRMGFGDVTPFSIVGAPLGMARAALATFAADLKKGHEENGDRPYQDGIFLRLAKASANVDAAINLVLSDARKVDKLADPDKFDEISRRELPRNWAWAVQTCRDAVNEIYEAAGGSVIYNKSPLQRIWRDINSSAQHFGFTEDRAMIDYARARLGLQPEQFVLQKAKRN